MSKALKIVTVIAVIVIIYALLNLPKECSYSTVEFEPIPFEAMVAHSIDVAYAEYVADQEEAEPVSGAPYDFITLDDDLQIYLEERCAEYEIDFFIMASLIFSESSFRTEAVGDHGNSVGLCQINKVWWESMAKKGFDVNEPKDNIECGLMIFSQYLDKASGDYEKAIQYFKCGPSRGRRLWKQGKKLSAIENIMTRAEEWRNK